MGSRYTLSELEKKALSSPDKRGMNLSDIYSGIADKAEKATHFLGQLAGYIDGIDPKYKVYERFELIFSQKRFESIVNGILKEPGRREYDQRKIKLARLFVNTGINYLRSAYARPRDTEIQGFLESIPGVMDQMIDIMKHEHEESMKERVKHSVPTLEAPHPHLYTAMCVECKELGYGHSKNEAKDAVKHSRRCNYYDETSKNPFKNSIYFVVISPKTKNINA